MPLDVDELICRVLNVGVPGASLEKTVTEADLTGLCQLARDRFASQSPLIELEPPVKICGDTHGQYADVLRLFDRGGFPPLVNYLFLGDYVDRGHQSTEVIVLFFCYKVKYPSNFFILRGNHECSAINRVYGFHAEVSQRYSVRLWNSFQDAFAMMPFCALVGEKILCMHGGISQNLTSLQALRDIKRPCDEIPNPSLQIDLLWADPDPHIKDGFAANSRGVSYVFGALAVGKIVKDLSIDLIVRAHQVVQDGYEFFANKQLVTVFSAPHYCGQLDNAAAMMNVDEHLICSFHIMRPQLKTTKLIGRTT